MKVVYVLILVVANERFLMVEGDTIMLESSNISAVHALLLDCDFPYSSFFGLL